VPNLLGYARDSDTQYLFPVQCKESSEIDFSVSFLTGMGSVSIEFENSIPIHQVNDGERVFFHDCLRKSNHGGFRKQKFTVHQGEAAWVSIDTNKDINQFWEDGVFDVRHSDGGLGLDKQK